MKKTESCQIDVCLRYPSDYPIAHLLVELKSVTISGKLLAGLTTLAEQKAKEILGKPQVANCCYLFICLLLLLLLRLLCLFCVYFGSHLAGGGKRGGEGGGGREANYRWKN